LGDFKAEAAGIGPAFLWTTRIADKDVAFIAKWLHEYDAKKRFEEDHVYASRSLFDMKPLNGLLKSPKIY
jgi:hypothetical protein